MRLFRKILAIALVSLVAGSGAATAGPVHFHEMDASESVHDHLVMFTGHEADAHDHHDADAAAAATDAYEQHDSERAPGNDNPDTDPVFHVHGCSHPAIVVQAEFVERTEKVALAVWCEMNTSVRSLGHSPPRKPPRPFL
jgi:hypothetical protein